MTSETLTFPAAEPADPSEVDPEPTVSDLLVNPLLLVVRTKEDEPDYWRQEIGQHLSLLRQSREARAAALLAALARIHGELETIPADGASLREPVEIDAGDALVLAREVLHLMAR